MGNWKTKFLLIGAFLPMVFFVLPVSSQSQKVNLSIYYESLSQPSALFIVQNLSYVFNNRLIDVINLRMVPWGNSRVDTVHNTTICQNGPDECRWNNLQACVINVYKDPTTISNNIFSPNVPSIHECSENDVFYKNTHYGAISCIEQKVLEKSLDDAKEFCFDQQGLSLKPVKNCLDSGTGTKLSLAYGTETGRLNPPPKFLPWLLVDDRPLENNYGKFMSDICNAYKGSVKPEACSPAPPNNPLN